MRLVIYAVALAVLPACGSKAPPAPRAERISIATRSDDEGVFLRFHGPAHASYYLPNQVILTADDTGDAHGGMIARDVPVEGAFDVVVKWGDRLQNVVTVRAELTPLTVVPTVWIDALPERPSDELDYTPAINVECSGSCAGPVTFRDGVGLLSAFGTTGCTLRVAGQNIVLDGVPTWDDGGRFQRPAHRVSLDLSGDVLESNLPDVLEHPLELPVALDCPSRPPAALPPLALGPGAMMTALRDRFHSRPGEPGASGRHRNVIAIHGSQHLEGLDQAKGLVQFFGAPTKAKDVDLVAKVKEALGSTTRCPIEGGIFVAESRSFEIEVYERDGTKLRDVPVAAPDLKCGDAEGLREVRSFSGDDVVRVVRPSDAAVGAALRAVLDPR